MISNKTILFGVILSFALLLFLAFPTRLPFNLDPSLAQTQQTSATSPKIKNQTPPIQKVFCDPGLYISQNLGKGQFIQVSDGVYYEVSPDDIRLAAYWLGPAPITFCLSDDDDYPIQITNTYSKTSVRVKESSYDDIIEKMKQLNAATSTQDQTSPNQAPPLQKRPRAAPSPTLPNETPLGPMGPTTSPAPNGPTGSTGSTGATGPSGIKKPALKPTRPTSPSTRTPS